MLEQADNVLDVLTEHWKVILSVLGFLMWGGYLVARYRTSGMRKLLTAHSEILDDLQNRLGHLRLELDNTRQELSRARAKGYDAEAEVERLKARIESLEESERNLLNQITQYQQQPNA